MAKFGTVGAIAFVVDMGLFNLLALPGMALEHKPTTAKIISAVVATVVSWLLNRSWTFKSNARSSKVREFVMFALVNGAGIAVAALTLWVVVYPLGFDDPLAKNAASILGIGFGTIVRYFGYKLFVFRGGTSSESSADAAIAADGDVPPQPKHPVEVPDRGRAESEQHSERSGR